MAYEFLWQTYETERVKVLSAWSMFEDDNLDCRPHVKARDNHWNENLR